MPAVELQFDPKALPNPEKMKEDFRELRDKYLSEAEQEMKHYLDESIETSGLRDTHGKVKRWQKVYRSKGYAAVRPEASSTGANSPGAITNYLESGHRGRNPSGKSARYRPRVRTGRAKAFRFYKTADSQVKVLAADVEKRMATELNKRMEEKK